MDQRMLIPTETLIDDRRQSFATDDVIRLTPNGFRVEGPGMIDSVLVRARSTDYRVVVETDSATIVDDTFDTLKTLSSDLSHIDAYDDGGDHVVVVQDYPYREWSTVTIDPGSSVTFERLRGEWILGIPVDF